MALRRLRFAKVQSAAGINSQIWDISGYDPPIVIKSVSLTARHASTYHGWERIGVKGRNKDSIYEPLICRGFAIPYNTGDTARYSFFSWNGYKPIDSRTIPDLLLCTVTNVAALKLMGEVWFEEGVK